MEHLLFTYGTLRAGEPNNAILNGHQEFLGSATTVERYLMIVSHYSVAFPYLIPAGYWPEMGAKAAQITGDIFKITTQALRRCDKLEGHPEWYKRTTIRVVDSAGTEHEVQAYILTREAFEEYSRDSYDVIECGDWKKFLGRGN